MRMISVLFLCCFGFTVQAETLPPPEYTQPKLPLLSLITEIPNTAINTVKYSFRKESIPAWAAILGTTAVLYHYDEDIYSGTKENGRRWGIGNEDHTKTVVKGGGFDLLRLPSDTGSLMYFLGDGWIHFGTAIGFWTYGALADNNRAYNTGIQIFHGMVTATIFSQGIKRAAGRESPNNSTEPRGKWRPFPSIKEYQAHTARYDAMPSGHIMTAALAFTVINENYPEYFWYTFPVECVWLGALGFEMVNNGVHWASDYPLGIGIGYAVGKMATRMTLKQKDIAALDTKPNWTFFPSASEDGPLLNAMYSF